mmetsp:Transcript_24784/g.52539  ORF Transcript_24784/g.52539 Transcript_24784/m.52539 type:complete len:203 (-) Transcript_24784:86-694(-)
MTPAAEALHTGKLDVGLQMGLASIFLGKDAFVGGLAELRVRIGNAHVLALLDGLNRGDDVFRRSRLCPGPGWGRERQIGGVAIALGPRAAATGTHTGHGGHLHHAAHGAHTPHAHAHGVHSHAHRPHSHAHAHGSPHTHAHWHHAHAHAAHAHARAAGVITSRSRHRLSSVRILEAESELEGLLGTLVNDLLPELALMTHAV